MPVKITVLQAVNDASHEIGISQQPISSAVGSRDQDVYQMAALLNAVADEILLEEPYKYSLGDGYWLLSASGEPRARVTDDTDVIQFDARLAISCLKYRFLKAKALEYGEDMRDFTTRLNKLAGRGAGVLDLDEGGRIQ